MKKYLYTLLILLLMPVLVNAETLTYDVCDTCEYTSLGRAARNIDSLENVSNTDIIINIDTEYIDNGGEDYFLSSRNGVIKSVIFNGNNYSINMEYQLIQKK